MTRSDGVISPAMEAKVGSRSMVEVTASLEVAAGNFSRPPGDAWHPQTAFPGQHLVTANGSALPGMITRDECLASGSMPRRLDPRAVVGGENHERVLREPEFVQGLHDLAATPVDLLHGIAKWSARHFLPLNFSDAERDRGMLCEVEKNGFSRLLANKIEPPRGCSPA
ncbi:MAG: hypothetical protein R3B90_15940 [Planctomycetaceae bacterium]